ncbi:MAG: ABC transporter permease [Candidatus Acidiferrales bacterium]
MNWFTNLFSRRRRYDDISEEIREHLDEKVDELVAAGIPRPDAIAAARRQFGNVALIEERTREVWQWSWLEDLFADIRYALRTLRKSPGFTAVAIPTLALGIGANTAIFSVVDAVLFRALPYRDPGRLVWATNFFPEQGQDFVFQNIYAGWRDQSHVFKSIAAYSPSAEYTLTGAGFPERMRGAQVTSSFLDVLGVTPQLGRNFIPEEGRPGGPKVVLLSDAVWRSIFGSDPKVVGRGIALDGTPYTVVGVLPRDFEFLDNSSVDLLVPMQFADTAIEEVNGRAVFRLETMQVVARLRPRVSVSAAVSELDPINERVVRDLPSHGIWLLNDAQAQVISLHDREIGNVRPALLVLLGAVGLVLLITCANVANMQLARAVSRDKEVAIRGALGAGRWRLARLLLTESSAVALAGGAAGLLLSDWTIRLIQRFGPANIPHLQSARIDERVLMFTLGLSLLTGILFGFAPVVAAFHVSLNDTLKDGASHSGASKATRRAQQMLIVTEIALSFVLFTGAGLLVKSFRRLTAIHLGFDPHGVLTARVALPRDQYQSEDQQRAFFQQLVAKLQALPGVDSAGATAWVPLRGITMFSLIGIEGQPPPDFSMSDVPNASANSVTPGYFAALRIPLIEGRLLDERDGASAPNPVLVNQVFVHRYFPNGNDPIGQKFNGDVGAGTDGLQTATIVGVIGDTNEESLVRETIPEITVSALEYPRFAMTLVLRTSADPLSLVSAVRLQVSELDKNLPIYDVQTMDNVVSAEIASQRFNAGAVAGFAGLAALLAAVGIYGVTAYAVSQRTHEMGVRIALGAGPQQVRRMVVFQGMTLAFVGVASGVGSALALTRLMRSLLFEVKPWDPMTMVLVAVLLGAVSLVATYLPARRASRVDPMVALRYE